MVGIGRAALLLTLLTLLTACSPDGQSRQPAAIASEAARGGWVWHTEWSSQVRLANWDVEYRGLGVGFLRPEERQVHPYHRQSTRNFELQPGSPFSTILTLSTGHDRPYPVLLSVFLDYQQVDFVLDSQSGVLHYLEIVPVVNMEVPLEVPIATPGLHDLFVVAFPQPESHPTEPQERLPPGLGVGGRRTVICVRDCTTPARELPPALVGLPTDDRSLSVVTGLPLMGNSGQRPQERLLLVTTVNPGEQLPIDLWARNGSDSPRRYVALPLLDFQQTQFAGSDALYLHMPPRSELLINEQFEAPPKAGIHELQMVYIFDPYRDLETEVEDPFVQSPLRSAVIVQ